MQQISKARMWTPAFSKDDFVIASTHQTPASSRRQIAHTHQTYTGKARLQTYAFSKYACIYLRNSVRLHLREDRQRTVIVHESLEPDCFLLRTISVLFWCCEFSALSKNWVMCMHLSSAIRSLARVNHSALPRSMLAS